MIHDLDLAQLDITELGSEADPPNKASGTLSLKFDGNFYPIQQLENAARAYAWGHFDPRPRDQAPIAIITATNL